MSRYKQYIKEIIYLIGDDRKKIPFFLCLIISSSVLDLLGIGLIAPYIGLIVNPAVLHESFAYTFINRFYVNPSFELVLQIVGVALVLVFLLKTFIAIFINKLILVFTFNHSIKLRTTLMESYQSLPYVDFIKRNSSEFIHNINLGAYFSQGILNPLLKLTSEGLVAIVILGFLAFKNGPALILLVTLLLAVVVIYDLVFRKRIKDFGRLSNIYANLILKGVNEGIGGIKEMRILGNEKFFSEFVTEVSEKHASINVKNQVITTLPRYFLEVILVTFIVLIVIISLRLGKNLTEILPLLSMFGVAGMRLAPSTSFIINGISQARFGRDTVHILYSDLINLKSHRSKVFDRPKNIKQANGFKSLELKNVSFRYPGAKDYALKDLNFSLKQGESVGLIGSSGAGKTTLVDLILGLLETNEGSIQYNGENIADHMNEWRSQIAYLPQQSFIIDGSLRANVAIGVNESEVNDERVINSLEQASLGDVLKELPDGLETRLGEMGVRLSGGQRQRVALARAFYHGRDILVLDESTSALDTQTEEEIVNEIKGLQGKKTLIIIAHRLETLRHCSKIYRIEKGTIAAKGSYESIILKRESV